MNAEGFFIDMEMTLVLGAAVNAIDQVCCGAALSKLGQDLSYPKATDGSLASLSYAHAFRFMAGGPITETPIPGLQIGAGFDFDIGIQTASNPNDTPAPTPHGDVYIALGIGPTVIWKPTKRLRVFAFAGPGAFLANNRDVFTGLQVAGAGHVLFTVLPRYLDVKGTLIGEHRAFFDGKFDPPNRGASFTTFSATIGLVGKFGWIFDIDDELKAMERDFDSDAPSPPSSSSSGQMG